MRSTKIIKICSSSLCTCLHHMVILRTRNKITDFLMILALASPFNYSPCSRETTETRASEITMRCNLMHAGSGRTHKAIIGICCWHCPHLRPQRMSWRLLSTAKRLFSHLTQAILSQIVIKWLHVCLFVFNVAFILVLLQFWLITLTRFREWIPNTMIFFNLNMLKRMWNHFTLAM